MQVVAASKSTDLKDIKTQDQSHDGHERWLQSRQYDLIGNLKYVHNYYVSHRASTLPWYSFLERPNNVQLCK